VSFLIDPPLLYASGRAYAELTRDRPDADQDRAIGAVTVAAFLAISVALYLDRRWTRPIWRLCGAHSGRDWMLNSGLLRLNWRSPGASTHLISSGIFITYPYWWWRGLRAGRARRR
jgi:hypothetical protein